MILRALFWIAIIVIMAPREPNLGYGKQGAGMIDLPASVVRLMGAPQGACDNHAKDCAAVLGVVDNLQDMALRGLARVKAEIAESQRERARQNADNGPNNS